MWTLLSSDEVHEVSPVPVDRGPDRQVDPKCIILPGPLGPVEGPMEIDGEGKRLEMSDFRRQSS